MKLTELKYNLPKQLIAQKPAAPRDHSRLMVIDRKSGKITHHHFYDLLNFLTKNDVLVFNQSKVFPARMVGTKDTGRKIELLLLTKTAGNTWQALRRGKVTFGQTLVFKNIKCKVIEIDKNVIKVKFSCRENDLFNYLNGYGLTPLPPYIKISDAAKNEKEIRGKYQTIYAKTKGSAAAPTAGLHFTKDLISKLKKKKIQMEYLTLHVGLGTFAPVKETVLEKHKIHEEHFSIDAKTIKRVKEAKLNGKRIIAVGTTTTRVLETVAQGGKSPTNIFIYPPYKFKIVDGLITNFHLPESTLLALVYAFAGKKLTKDAYNKAIKEKYRFFSFGDASLII